MFGTDRAVLLLPSGADTCAAQAVYLTLARLTPASMFPMALPALEDTCRGAEQAQATNHAGVRCVEPELHSFHTAARPAAQSTRRGFTQGTWLQKCRWEAERHGGRNRTQSKG